MFWHVAFDPLQRPLREAEDLGGLLVDQLPKVPHYLLVLVDDGAAFIYQVPFSVDWPAKFIDCFLKAFVDLGNNGFRVVVFTQHAHNVLDLELLSFVIVKQWQISSLS